MIYTFINNIGSYLTEIFTLFSIKTCLNFITTLIFLFSIFSLIYSLYSTNPNCKNLLKVNIVYILYSLLSTFFFPLILSLDMGVDAILLYLMTFISVICYIISIIILAKKHKKVEANSSPKTLKAIIFVLILLPIILFTGSYLKEQYLIKNSDIVLVYYSRGNGGLGDGGNYAYAINEKYCEEISLGITIDGYDLKKFLPKKAIETTDTGNIKNYNVELDEDRKFLVYKNGKLIHQKTNFKYFNNELKKVFYINNS